MFKNLAKKLGIYQYLRYSRIYHNILKFKSPQYIGALEADLAFYREALGDGVNVIFDVGANHGDKAWAFTQISDLVVCFEPDKTCFEALRKRYRKRRDIFLENVALGEEVGTGIFFVEEEGSAFNTLNEKERDWIITEQKKSIREVLVPVSTLDRMIEKYGCPDFIKIDVEGAEEQVFKGLNRFIPIICFEANLPRFQLETLKIIDRFSSHESTRFNLRLDDNFVFETHKRSEDILSTLMKNREVSFDVFVFCEK
jgi:FkbM family methyltransferase